MATPALGTTEYTNYLIDQGKSLGMNLEQYRVPAATAPTTPTEIKQETDTKMPSASYGTGNVAPVLAMASAEGVKMQETERLNKEQIDLRLRQEEIRAKEQKSLLSSLTKGAKSPAVARKEAWEETGIEVQKHFADQKARIAKLDTLGKEYASVKEAMDTQIAQSRDKLGTNNFINNQIQQIERNAAPKLNRISANMNAEAATMQALQGNFATAQSFVNQAVQDATADLKYRFDLFDTFYKINEDKFDRIDSIYADAYNSKREILKMEYEQGVADKSAVGEYMIKYNSIGAGITIEDTLQEAQAKVAAAGGDIALLNKQEATKDAYQADGGNGGSNEIGSASSFADIMQSAIDAGATPEEAAREAALSSENSGIPVTQKQLSIWVAEARKLKATPIDEPAAVAPSAPSSGTAFSIGQAFGSDIKPLVQGPAGMVKSTVSTVGSFFQGLFNN